LAACACSRGDSSSAAYASCSHAKIEQNHSKLFLETDKPIAGLLRDLKQRGLLDSTLVVWGGEFGRTPMSEKGDGRDHNPTGFTMWMAGGGVKGGQVIGETDELGLRAVQDRLHVHDLHATILHLLGIENLKLTYKFKGRPENPTLNEGEAYRKIAG
jgi:arylsulfatase A-like enzyme